MEYVYCASLEIAMRERNSMIKRWGYKEKDFNYREDDKFYAISKDDLIIIAIYELELITE